MTYGPRRGVGSLLLLAGLCLPGAAWAQEEEEFDPPFVPSNERVDEELDRSLQEEYEGGGAPPQAERVHPNRRAAAEAPAPPPPPPPADDDDDDLRLTLGGMAAHYATLLQDVVISHRQGLSGGAEVELDGDADAADFDVEHSQTYRAWFDIGQHVSLEGGFRRTVFRDQRRAGQNFTFGSTTFGTNTLVDSMIDLRIADFDVVFKPVNNRWFELGIHFGGRYVFWRTELQRPTTGQSEESTIEALLPMIGLSMAIRPASWLELFARGRFGHFEYEREEHWRIDDDGDIDHVEAKEREQTSVELDAGLQFLIADTIGIIVGYRLDWVKLEREVESEAEGVEGAAHGAYGGVVLEF